MIDHNDPRFDGMSKTEKAYELIKEKITSNEFAPGHRLVLSSIADALDVSVVPVREAIRQLEAEGLVDFERNVGARVAMIDRQMYIDCMQTTAILEGAATALAAPYLTPSQLAKARELNEKMETSLTDLEPKEFTVLNRKFHRTLFSSCPNRDLVNLILTQWNRLDYLRESTFAFVPDRAWESVKEHSRILMMIQAEAEPVYIEKLARDHRLATLEQYLNSRPETKEE